MPTLRDDIRSTFPIPANKLRARKAGIILTSPVTWIPLISSYAFFAFNEITSTTALACAAVSLIGITIFWKLKNSKLDRAILEELISESNKTQDKHLSKAARRLFDEGYPPYASTLGSFISLKKVLEEALHKSPTDPPNPKVAELETLIDDVVFGVADQLERLVDLNRRLERTHPPVLEAERTSIETAGKEISARIHEAFLLLETTWNDLSILLDPTTGITPENTNHSRLEDAITRLREEQDQATRIRTRMLSDFGPNNTIAPMDHTSIHSPDESAAESVISDV